MNPILFVLLGIFFYFFTISALIDAYKENNNSRIITGALSILFGTIFIILRTIRYKKEIRKAKTDQT